MIIENNRINPSDGLLNKESKIVSYLLYDIIIPNPERVLKNLVINSSGKNVVIRCDDKKICLR